MLVEGSRYVGNTMAAFVMQVLGYEVAALNTVQFSKFYRSLPLPLPPPPPPFSKHIYMYNFAICKIRHNNAGSHTVLADIPNPSFFSSSFPKGNHTGYGQFKGTKASAQDIQDIYHGLKQSYLTDFDVLLSGYAPSADAVQAVGAIARDLKLNAAKKPGSFFWGE